MAIMTPPVLSISSSLTPGRSDIHVSCIVTFDAYDVASLQPYHAHIDLRGDDTGTGDGATAGGDDQLWFRGAGDFSAANGNPFILNDTFNVPTTVLNEDTGDIPNPDEIRAVVTLSPVAPKVVGPTESQPVKLTL